MSVAAALVSLMVDYRAAADNAARLTILHAPVYVRVGDTDVPRILTRLPFRGDNGEFLCEAGGEVHCCSKVTMPTIED